MRSNRRTFMKRTAAKSIVASSAIGLLGSAKAADDDVIVDPQVLDNPIPEEVETNTGRETYDSRWWDTRPDLEAVHGVTLGWYEAYETNTDGWVHEMVASGVGTCMDADDNEGFNTFDGAEYSIQFDEDEYQSDWDIDLRTNRRAIYPFDGDGDEIEIPGQVKVGAQVVIPTVIGAFSVPAGAAAAVTLSANDFLEEFEPDDGVQSLPYGGAKYRRTNSYHGISESCVAYCVRFRVIHGYDDPASFEMESEIYDRIRSIFPYSMRPSTELSGTAFKDDKVMDINAGQQSQLTHRSEQLDTYDPAKMTDQQRERFGIKKVDESMQDLAAERLDADADRVRWITAGN